MPGSGLNELSGQMRSPLVTHVSVPTILALSTLQAPVSGFTVLDQMAHLPRYQCVHFRSGLVFG